MMTFDYYSNVGQSVDINVNICKLLQLCVDSTSSLTHFSVETASYLAYTRVDYLMEQQFEVTVNISFWKLNSDYHKAMRGNFKDTQKRPHRDMKRPKEMLNYEKRP